MVEMKHRWHQPALLLAYMFVAVAVRGWLWPNPVVSTDEQLYTLMGERMLHGALPYVDIWDRKPVGLFVLFEGLARLGGPGPVACHAAATVCVGATAFVIQRLARNLATPAGAVLAGFTYIAWLAVFNCIGAQTPAFYNLPMVLAALLTLRIARRETSARLVPEGVLAMLLVGLAIQLKPTVVFEGIGMGLVLLWRAFADALSSRRIAAYGAIWIAAALLPTIAAFATYVALGHADAFIEANVISIFHRHDALADKLSDLATSIALLLPFAIAIVAGWSRRHGDPLARLLVIFWAVIAFVGFLGFGTYYDHYATPLLLPFSVLAAPALGRMGRDIWPSALLLGFGIVAGAIVTAQNLAKRGNAAQVARAAALITPELHGRCLYVFEGDTALYSATGSCLPTRYPFPPHLHSATETRAIDQTGELARLLARRPGVIVLPDHSFDTQPNPATLAMLRATLARAYARYASAKIGRQTYDLYRLKD